MHLFNLMDWEIPELEDLTIKLLEPGGRILTLFHISVNHEKQGKPNSYMYLYGSGGVSRCSTAVITSFFVFDWKIQIILF